MPNSSSISCYRFIEEGMKHQREGTVKSDKSSRGRRQKGKSSKDGGDGNGGVAEEAFKALRSRALAGARTALLSSIQADLDRKR